MELRLPREAHDASGDACLDEQWLGIVNRSTCTRRAGHQGRHAFIGKLTGRVYAVWGDDIHAEVRNKARLEVTC